MKRERRSIFGKKNCKWEKRREMSTKMAENVEGGETDFDEISASCSVHSNDQKRERESRERNKD